MYFGIVYSGVSLLLEFILFFNIRFLILFRFISHLLFLFFILFFSNDISRVNNINNENNKECVDKRYSYLILFVQHFVYVLVITNFALIATIGLHEFGHVFVARYYGCESRAIIFERYNYPYSEIICKDLSVRLPIVLAGPILPIIVSLSVLFLGGKFLFPISLLTIGFNLFAAYQDFLEIGIGEAIALTIAIVGIIFIFFGVTLLARHRMEDSSYFNL
ncbi:MAG: hypothetical protein QXJ28_02975 [Candidatus Pacearchaeota archaeon]